MQLPRPRNISIAIIVFVLSPDGEVDTVALAPMDLDDLLAGTGRPQGSAVAPSSSVVGLVPDRLRDSLRAVLPSVVLGARMRPLTPRFLADGALCLPLWTTGRLVEAGAARPDRRLATLASTLGDPTLEVEAETEFRRTLASDPMVHQMVGDATRSRALAADEALREPPPGEVPPMFALLPEVFTIDQLRVAASQVVLAAGAEIERSSNFRRRVSDFIESGVFVDCGEAVGTSHRGRPPRAYRFDPTGWQDWLHRRSAPSRISNDLPASDLSLRADRVASYVKYDRNEVPPAPSVRFDLADEAVHDDLSLRENVLSREGGSGSWTRRRSVRASGRASGRGDETAREPRVEDLERQVERLSGEVQAGRAQMTELMRLLGAELRARRSGGDEPRR